MIQTDTLLDDLESGRARAAWPDPDAPDGWRVDNELRTAILARFANREVVDTSDGIFHFRDRAALPPRGDVPDGVVFSLRTTTAREPSSVWVYAIYRYICSCPLAS